MIAMQWWTREYPVIQLSKEAEITEDIACDIYQWFREVCSTKLLNTPITLGGPGVIVQIDESQFKHKPKVSRILIYFTNINIIVFFSITAS